MILELVSGVISSMLGGGATGLLGITIQRYFDHKKQVQDLEVIKANLANAVEIRRAELEYQERMASRGSEEREFVAKLEAQSRESEALERSLAASYRHDTPTYSGPDSQTLPPEVLQTSGFARYVFVLITGLARLLMVLVDFCRGMIRPSMTTYTIYLLTLLMVWVQSLVNRTGTTLTPEQVLHLTMTIIDTITYLSTLTTTWWFGVRPSVSKKT